MGSSPHRDTETVAYHHVPIRETITMPAPVSPPWDSYGVENWFLNLFYWLAGLGDKEEL